MKKSTVFNLTVLFSTLYILFSPKANAQMTVEQEIYNKGIDNFYKKYYYQAIDDFNILINTNKVDYLFYSYMYRAYSKTEVGKYLEAISEFTTALGKYPNNADLLNGRAWANCFAGYYNSAVSDANRALSITKQGNFYDTRATAYALLRSNSNAISDFNESIKLEGKALYYYKRGLVKKFNMDYKGADNDFATAKALDKSESYKNLNDPLYAVFVYKKQGTSNSASSTSNQGSTITARTPMALSTVKHKTTFGSWYIYFPGKPIDKTSSNSTLSTNYTALYQTGEWQYFVQYIVIDYSHYKKYLMNDFLKDFRQQYAKAINSTLGNVSTTTNNNFDESCSYTMSGGGLYGYFRDGIIDNRVVRIGLFNSKRYPTYIELNEFYNTFSKTY